MSVVALDSRRAATLGGSEAAAACGIDPYRSRIALWAEKTGRVERIDSEAAQLGRALQPAVARLVAEAGYDVLPAPAEPAFAHPERPWQTAHPDAFVALDGGRGVLECKTRGVGWADDAALYAYVLQVQHYLAVLGLGAGLLAILHGGHGGLRLELLTVEHDAEVAERMTALEAEFLTFVRRDTPPAPDGSDSARDTLRALYPDAEPAKTVRLSQQAWTDLLEVRRLDESIRLRKAERDARAQRVQAFMGDAEHAISPYDTPGARWSAYTRTSLDVTAIREQLPAIAERYAKTTTTRRFDPNP